MQESQGLLNQPVKLQDTAYVRARAEMHTTFLSLVAARRSRRELAMVLPEAIDRKEPPGTPPAAAVGAGSVDMIGADATSGGGAGAAGGGGGGAAMAPL